MNTDDKLFMVFNSLNRSIANPKNAHMVEGIQHAQDVLKIWFDKECQHIGVGNEMSWFSKNETCYEHQR